MNIFSGSNAVLWILIALVVLGNGGCNNNALSGCTLPILLALGYCLYRNGSLSNLFTPTGSCGCGCGN